MRAMGAGLVCHTLNPRLTVAHLAAMVNEAEDRVLAVAANLLPLAARAGAALPGVEHRDPAGRRRRRAARLALARRMPIWAYEDLLADARRGRRPGAASTRRAPAGLCYTSGTTGAPKGVALHPPLQLPAHAARAAGRRHGADRPRCACWSRCRCSTPMAGVCPSPRRRSAPSWSCRAATLDGASLARLMRDEGVTVAVGVQTVWLGVRRPSRRDRRRCCPT